MEATFKDLYLSLADERALDHDISADRRLYVGTMHRVNDINPADELLLQLQRATSGAWFFTGHRGVGKSTELKRIAYRLRLSGDFVVTADMNDYLNLSEPIAIELLLLTMMAALSNEYNKQFSNNPLRDGLAKRIFRFLRNTEVTLSELSITFGVEPLKAQGKLGLKENPTLREKILRAVQASFVEFIGEVRSYVDEVRNGIATTRPNAKCVIILDSLERLRVSGLGADERFDAVQNVFEVHASHLKFDRLLVVYSIPPYLPYLIPRLGAHIGANICYLPHVKVFQSPREGGTSVPNISGINDLVQAVTLRYPQVEEVLPREGLVRLAMASSGSPREYFRLIKTVCLKAELSKDIINGRHWTLDSCIEQAEQELRGEMPLAQEDIDWLIKVRRTNRTGLSHLGDLSRLARLFDCGMILTYRDRDDWCEVNYLLRSEVDRAAFGK